MCIAYIALACHPDWPLIIAANRDEFHARPTLAAAYWKQNPDLLAGRDQRAGGTWLGIHPKHRRISLITNFREPGNTQHFRQSRGELALHCLNQNKSSSLQALQTLEPQAHDYAGFNLLSLDLLPIDPQSWTAQAAYLSNRNDGKSYELAAGIHVLSNHLLNTAWPKSEYLREHILAQGFDGSAQSIQQIFAILRTDQPAADHMLPTTGLPLERERLLSSPFIISPEYGTRCSSLVAINRQGEGLFIERSFDSQARLQSQHDWYFQLSSPFQNTP